MKSNRVVRSLIMFPIDRGAIHELAIDVHFAVRPIKSPDPDLRVARLLGSRDRWQSLRGRALLRRLEGDDARFVVVDNCDLGGPVVLALQVDELRLFYLIICGAF